MDYTGHLNAALGKAEHATGVRFELEGGHFYTDLPDRGGMSITQIGGGQWRAQISTVKDGYNPEVTWKAMGHWEHVRDQVINKLTAMREQREAETPAA